VCVISQAVEQLRAISLRIDRLQLSVLDVFLSFRCLHRLSRDVQATATLPNSSHAGQWTQVVQRVDDHLRRLNINIGSVGRHAAFRINCVLSFGGQCLPTRAAETKESSTQRTSTR
jgi:hypothetical protein